MFVVKLLRARKTLEFQDRLPKECQEIDAVLKGEPDTKAEHLTSADRIPCVSCRRYADVMRGVLKIVEESDNAEFQQWIMDNCSEVIENMFNTHDQLFPRR